MIIRNCNILRKLAYDIHVSLLIYLMRVMRAHFGLFVQLFQLRFPMGRSVMIRKYHKTKD
jgi:hypothetical protein